MVRIYTFLMILTMVACSKNKEVSSTLVNNEHLMHLTDNYVQNQDTLGAVWIYCEAPDYHFITDEDEGYTCVDDVARALVFLTKEYKKNPTSEAWNQIEKYTAFILSMQSDDGFFFNFVFPDKTINKTHQNSVAEPNWWSWRAFWAFSELVQIPKNSEISELQNKAKNAMDSLLPYILSICSEYEILEEADGVFYPTCIKEMGTDQLGLLVIGLSNYYARYPKEEIRTFLQRAGEILSIMQKGSEGTFPYYASMSWQNYWHAWGNSQAFALLNAGQILNDEKLIQYGLREVDHFYPYYLEERPSGFKLVKEGESFIAENEVRFPQIAYNLRPMIYATLKAYEITKDPKYETLAIELGSWFFGENQAGKVMYNQETGRTYDGIISMSDINLNSGAESTIEGLLSMQYLELFPDIIHPIMKRSKE